MFEHNKIWQAIDNLAELNGLSSSGLAKKAHLDPTTFNKSKRHTREGKPRWPSTESIAKVLEATSTTLSEFTDLIDEDAQDNRRLPIIDGKRAGSKDMFDDKGYPLGHGWDEVNFPDIDDPYAYAIEATGSDMLPIYREGDILIISPDTSIRKGDRIIVKTLEGRLLARELVRKTAHHLEVSWFNPKQTTTTIPLKDIVWMARILWVSQ